MRVDQKITCVDFPCQDTSRQSHLIPEIAIDPARISVLLISECAPENRADYYYAVPNSLFCQTTVLAFQEAGAKVESVQDILALGVYLTTAVKCGKMTPGLTPATVEHCSHLLEKEIALFPNVKVLLLMGDVAIKALNTIARRNGEPRVIPTGATYKLRGGEYSFRGMRALPSYVQAGPAFFVEKSKRKMIAEDIRTALEIASK
jgi:uracil-DNA glycosylase